MNEPPGSECASAIGRHEIKIVDASIAESRLLPVAQASRTKPGPRIRKFTQ
jgi:hypothetical protein